MKKIIFVIFVIFFCFTGSVGALCSGLAYSAPENPDAYASCGAGSGTVYAAITSDISSINISAYNGQGGALFLSDNYYTAEQYKDPQTPTENNTYKVVIISISAAAICAAVLICVVILKYKMKLQPTNYPLDEFTETEITESKDTFITSRVTRIRIKKDKDSSD